MEEKLFGDATPEATVSNGAESEKQVAPKRSKSKKQRASSRREPKRVRVQRNFPAVPFEEALTIANAIQQIAAGQQIRRLRLFEQMGKSPDSGPSRQLITNSAKYGLTKGSYIAEFIELTELGKIATSDESSSQDKLKARFKLAIDSIPPFNALYEKLKGNKLPAVAVMRDFLVEQDYDETEVAECVDTFIVNAKSLGLLRTIAGAERLLPIEHVLDELPRSSYSIANVARPTVVSTGDQKGEIDVVDWDKICFYITPIGEEESEERQHSDLFLNHIIEPALQEFGLVVIRADQIGKPGMITGQVIEHIVRSKLVIADLSYHNPNVFYEVCLRHVCRLPIVQVIRKKDRIPFDLDQFRTVQIDNSSIYTLVPQLETHRSEIATQVRQAIENPDAVDSPISVFYPGLVVSLPSIAKSVSNQTGTLAMAKSAAS